MNDTEVNSMLRMEEHVKIVNDIDVNALYAALLGSPTLLNKLEEGLAVTICDINELDQPTVAAGMKIHPRTLQRRILDRRNEVLNPHHLALVADAVREPIDALLKAVHGGDGPTVAAILKGYDRVEMTLLVLVLADALARVGSELGRVLCAE